MMGRLHNAMRDSLPVQMQLDHLAELDAKDERKRLLELEKTISEIRLNKSQRALSWITAIAAIIAAVASVAQIFAV